MVQGKQLYVNWLDLSTVSEQATLSREFVIALFAEEDIINPFDIGNEQHENCLVGILIGKADNKEEYEVYVQKNDESDQYIPAESDNIKHYVDNGRGISFFFDTYTEARHFADEVLPFHEEFQDRPIKPIH